METPSFRLERGCSCDFIFFVFQLSVFSAMHDLQLYPSICTYCTGLPTRGDLCDLLVETESFFSLLCYRVTPSGSFSNCAVIFKQSMGAGNRVGIGCLTGPPSRLHMLAELIPLESILGLLKNFINSSFAFGLPVKSRT
jgi:hypothetical protein